MPLNPLILKHVFHRLLAPWNTLPEEIPWPTKCGNPSKLQPRFRIKGSERKHFDPTLPKLTWRGTILLPCARVCVCVFAHTCVHKCTRGTQYSAEHFGECSSGHTGWGGSRPPGLPASSGLPQLQDMLYCSPLEGQPLKQDIFLGIGHSYSGRREAVRLSLRNWGF